MIIYLEELSICFLILFRQKKCHILKNGLLMISNGWYLRKRRLRLLLKMKRMNGFLLYSLLLILLSYAPKFPASIISFIRNSPCLLSGGDIRYLSGIANIFCSTYITAREKLYSRSSFNVATVSSFSSGVNPEISTI